MQILSLKKVHLLGNCKLGINLSDALPNLLKKLIGQLCHHFAQLFRSRGIVILKFVFMDHICLLAPCEKNYYIVKLFIVYCVKELRNS